MPQVEVLFCCSVRVDVEDVAAVVGGTTPSDEAGGFHFGFLWKDFPVLERNEGEHEVRRTGESRGIILDRVDVASPPKSAFGTSVLDAVHSANIFSSGNDCDR